MTDDEDKIIQMFEKRLENKNIDASFLQDNNYEFSQKFVLYRAALRGLDVNSLLNPDIPYTEMEDLLDEQMMQLTKVRANLGIDTSKYNFDQIRELIDGVQKGLDVKPYMSYEYSAQHMYVAKTFQQEQLGGLHKLIPNMSIGDFVKLREQERHAKSLSPNENLKIELNQDDIRLNAAPLNKLLGLMQQPELDTSIYQLAQDILEKSSQNLEKAKESLANAMILQNVDIKKYEEFNQSITNAQIKESISINTLEHS